MDHRLYYGKLIFMLKNNKHKNGIKTLAAEAIEELIKELSFYENTQLKPDCIEKLKLAYQALPKGSLTDGIIDTCFGVSLAEIKKLLDAKQAGLLIELPCTADTDLVRNGETYHGDHWNTTLTAFRTCGTPSGLQVALFSIDEAREAMRPKEGNHADTAD